MISSPRFDANTKVENYRKSVAFVDENVLMFKGFLGPSLKDKPEVASVGARAARAAGVIVDNLGKLRCPPGTPNANQFTDLQMSNCMVPGMGTAKKLKDRAANAIGKVIEVAGAAMDKKGVKGTARVATMAALVGLDLLDYNHNDGSGAMSASILAVQDIVRSAGREVAERALDRLQRNGKISQKQREQLDKVVDVLAPVAAERLVLGGHQAVNAWRRARQEKRKNRKSGGKIEITPSEDIDTSGLSPFRFGRASKEPNVGAPSEVTRQKGLTAVTVDADVFNQEFEQKVDGLVSKYMPEKTDSTPMEEVIATIGQRMGVRSSKPIEKQVDDSIDFLMDYGAKNADEMMTPQGVYSDEINEYRRQKGKAIKDMIAPLLDKDDSPAAIKRKEEARQAIKDAILRGYLETLVGVEMTLEDDPSLRGSIDLGLHSMDDARGMHHAAGYAGPRLGDDGKIEVIVRIVPDTIMFDQKALMPDRKGQALSQAVRFFGADDHQVGLGIHETGHAMHLRAQFGSLGLDIGENSKPLIEQVKEQGSNLGDSYVGILVARNYGLKTSDTWETVEQMAKDGKINAVGAYKRAVPVDANNVIYQAAFDETIKNRRSKDVLPKVEMGDIFGRGVGTRGQQIDLLINGLNNFERDQNFPRGINPNLSPAEFEKAVAEARKTTKFEVPGYDIVDADGNVLTGEDAANAVRAALGGLKERELTELHMEAMDEILGFDHRRVATNGVSGSLLMGVMGKASTYGQTNVMEAVAESYVLDVFTRRFTAFKQMDDSIKEARDMMEKVVPAKSAQKRPNMTPKAREHLERIQKIMQSMPQLRQQSGLEVS